MKYMLEICASSVESALAAWRGGADRVELCCGLTLDGLTPSAGAVRYVRKNCGRLAVNVLIRAREGDFIYSESEVDQMIMDIGDCAEAGADGVVIGALTPQGTIDEAVCGRLAGRAKELGLSVTMHRAVDYSRNVIEAYEAAARLGCDRVLTSGGFPKAMEGIENIARMAALRDELHGPKIMAGAGVRPCDIPALLEAGADEIHLSASCMTGKGFPLSQEQVVKEAMTKILN